MNKQELIAAIAAEASVTQAVADSVLQATLAVIQKTVAAGEEVSLIGFGAFKASERAARTGKNPNTGEALEIAAATVPKFSAGKKFKDAVAKK